MPIESTKILCPLCQIGWCCFKIKIKAKTLYGFATIESLKWRKNDIHTGNWIDWRETNKLIEYTNSILQAVKDLSSFSVRNVEKKSTSVNHQTKKARPKQRSVL